MFVDAVDQLIDTDGSPPLAWLPELLPREARLIVSTTPGPGLDRLQTVLWNDSLVGLSAPVP